MNQRLAAILTLTLMTLLVVVRCSSSESGESYDFTAVANGKLGLKSGRGESAPSRSTPSARVNGPTLCSSVICATPTVLTGRYYGTGFLIQTNGSGMTAYFGQDAWSTITGTSPSFPFDSATPTTNAGNLKCCGGTGDLTSSNTYISDVIYLFGYLDATFTLSGITSNTNMNRGFTVRFVLADGAITGGVRGDLLLKDPSDDVFKWMDTATSAGGDVGAGTLVTTRPTTPVQMNASVTRWTNPFGADKGNQTIPVIYAPVLPASQTGVFSITQKDLATVGKTYSYGFDPANLVMFPEILTADINSLSTYTALLSKIHLGGLPHSAHTGVGNPASTVLTVTGP